MRKKLDTRFPAARIKKIMQADEDIGKIALAVPVLVSKALELFLQDLCDCTYEITLQRGAKTMSALHLKHCVQRYNVFDFLSDIVSRVPDYGHGHSQGHSEAGGDDRPLPKRRKGDDLHDSDEESKKSKMHELSHTGSGSTGRGRGRGRGRSRGRGARTVERETYHQEVESEPCTSVQHNSKHEPNPSVAQQNSKHEPNPSVVQQDSKLDPNPSVFRQNSKHDLNPSVEVDNSLEAKEMKKQNTTVTDEGIPVCNIDLNTNLNENEDKNASIAREASLPEPVSETKHEEYPAWPPSEVDKMSRDPLQFADLGRRLDEDEEDYDEEG